MINNFIKKTLKNGVKLYLLKDPKMNVTFVDYGVFYGYSGYFDKFYLDKKYYHVLPGCAHFLEHLLGEHSKYGNLYKRFAQKNYKVNGETLHGITHYYFIGKDDIYNSLDELITAIDNPVFTPEDVNQTRKAIIEEVKMLDDNKYNVSTALCERNLFSNMELVTTSLNPLGDENTTNSINYEMLKKCYDAFYNNDNKYLMIAGNIDENMIISYIESIYDKFPNYHNKSKDYCYSDNDNLREKIDFEYMSTIDDLVKCGFREKKGERFTNKEIYYYLQFLFDSKFGSDSDFLKSLYKDNIITRFESSRIMFLPNYYYFILGFSVKDYETFLLKLKDELQKGNFSEDDFKLYKRMQIAKEVLKQDYKYETLKNFAVSIYYTDDFNDMEFIKKLDFENFLDFYKNLDHDNSTTAIIRNPEKIKISKQ